MIGSLDSKATHYNIKDDIIVMQVMVFMSLGTNVANGKFIGKVMGMKQMVSKSVDLVSKTIRMGDSFL